jgi:hypothetical protein
LKRSYRRWIYPAGAHIETEWPSSQIEVTEYAYKRYEFREKISGLKKANDNGHTWQEFKSDEPGIMFSYYERQLRLKSEDSRQAYEGGVPTDRVQLAVLIHRGFFEEASGDPIIAGFRKMQRQVRHPVYLCILGEVDKGGDYVAIRRLIVRGQEWQVTRENVARALRYGNQLAARIFGRGSLDSVVQPEAAPDIRRLSGRGLEQPKP